MGRRVEHDQRERRRDPRHQGRAGRAARGAPRRAGPPHRRGLAVQARRPQGARSCQRQRDKADAAARARRGDAAARQFALRCRQGGGACGAQQRHRPGTARLRGQGAALHLRADAARDPPRARPHAAPVDPLRRRLSDWLRLRQDRREAPVHAALLRGQVPSALEAREPALERRDEGPPDAAHPLHADLDRLAPDDLADLAGAEHPAGGDRRPRGRGRLRRDQGASLGGPALPVRHHAAHRAAAHALRRPRLQERRRLLEGA